MISTEYSNSINVTPQTEPHHIAARRLVERAYRKPKQIFWEPGYRAEITYEPMGIWCIVTNGDMRTESDYADAIFTLARMWAQESR